MLSFNRFYRFGLLAALFGPLYGLSSCVRVNSKSDTKAEVGSIGSQKFGADSRNLPIFWYDDSNGMSSDGNGVPRGDINFNFPTRFIPDLERSFEWAGQLLVQRFSYTIDADKKEKLRLVELQLRPGRNWTISNDANIKSSERLAATMDANFNTTIKGQEVFLTAVFTLSNAQGQLETMRLALEKPFHYFSFKINAKTTASISGSTFLASLAGLPPQVGQALGVLLDMVHFDFTSDFQLNDVVMTEFSRKVFINEGSSRAVNQLSKWIAEDIFLPTCRVLYPLEADKKEKCQINMSRFQSMSTVEMLGSYERLKIVSCETDTSGFSRSWLWFQAPKAVTQKNEDGLEIQGTDYMKGAKLVLYKQKIGPNYERATKDVTVIYHVDKEQADKCGPLAENMRCVRARLSAVDLLSQNYDCRNISKWMLSVRDTDKIILD